MRHLIVLPGNSLKNKGWGELILDHYGHQFDSSCMLEYDHWVNGGSNINFAIEEAKLKTHIESLSSDTEIILFAKSAGSLLALQTIHHEIVTPIQVVFFGMPLDLAADDHFKDSWAPLADLNVPAITFHNIADPATSYEFAKSMLATHNPNIQLVTVSELDHWYGDLNTYDSFIKLKLS